MSEAYLSMEPHSALIGAGLEVDPTQNHFKVSWNNHGVDVHIPPAPYAWRAARNSFWRSVDKVAVMIYPAPLLLVVAGAAGTCAFVYRAPPNSPVLTNAGMRWLRYWLSLIPFAHLVPERGRPAAMCGVAWTAALCGATVIHRFFLRRMLTYRGWIVEDPRRPSLATRLWSGVLKLCFIRTGLKRMEVYESCLPSLPLPSLQETVSKYLASVRAIYHQNEDDVSDWIDVRRAAESFLLNEGPILQRHLRFHHAWSPNYVTEWWTRNVLLSARVSLALYSNFFTIPFAVYTPTTLPQARAAVLTYHLVRLKQRLEKRNLPPQFTGPRGCVPVSVEQMFLAFNTTRIPGREVDRLDHDDSEDNNYVIVLHRGHVYQVPVRHPRTRKWLTPHQLEAVFQTILEEVEEVVSTGRDESEEEDSEPQSERATKRRLYRLAESLLPALTTAPRAQWADIRSNYLLNDANNHQPLRAIERALFVISFDDKNGNSSSSSRTENIDLECSQYFVGNGSSLWCDKSFNLVVRYDGKVGVHVEHSWCDAKTFLPLFEYVAAQEESQQSYDGEGHATKLPADKKFNYDDLEYILSPKRLRFTIHRKLASSIREAHTTFLTDIVSQLDLHVERYSSYGANLPDKLGCDRDAWVQMALQIAYFRIHDSMLSQMYESIMLRTFSRGRTDAVRSVTDESSNFVRAVMAPEEQRKSHEALLALLLSACERHRSLVQEVSAGSGIDRHIFALYMISAARQIPSDFLNAVMRKTQWKVTSMNLQQRYLPAEWHPIRDERPFETPACGFGPAAEDGYGVSYCFCGGGALYITVTCKKGCSLAPARTFGQYIKEALSLMASLTDIDIEALPGAAPALEEIPDIVKAAKEQKTPW